MREQMSTGTGGDLLGGCHQGGPAKHGLCWGAHGGSVFSTAYPVEPLREALSKDRRAG